VIDPQDPVKNSVILTRQVKDQERKSEPILLNPKSLKIFLKCLSDPVCLKIPEELMINVHDIIRENLSVIAGSVRAQHKASGKEVCDTNAKADVALLEHLQMNYSDKKEREAILECLISGVVFSDK